MKTYWITSTYAGWLNSLRVKEKGIDHGKKNMNPCLWFDNQQDADDLLREINNTIRKNYSNIGKPYPRTCYWITSVYAGHFDSLRVKKKKIDHNKNMSPCLWFDNQQDAEILLKEIEDTIRQFYRTRCPGKSCPIP